MIDWITAIVPFPHESPIAGGVNAHFDENGAMDWYRECFRQLEGSFEETSVIQTHWRTDSERTGGICRELWISGNPLKFLQGHNLFGSGNLQALAPEYFYAVCKAAGLEPDELTIQRWLNGDYQLDRVDVCEMIDLGDELQLNDCLETLAHSGSVVHRGRGTKTHGTVTFGKRTGRRSVFKFYDKHAEICAGKKHMLPKNLPRRWELSEWVKGKLRAEIEIHARELDSRNLRRGSDWHSDTSGLLWSSLMEKLTVTAQCPLTPLCLKNMPRKFQRTYMQWESGRDLRSWMSRATWHRHRKALLGFGVDIAAPCQAEHRPKVIELPKVITGRIAQIPAWAHGSILLKAA